MSLEDTIECFRPLRRGESRDVGPGPGEETYRKEKGGHTSSVDRRFALA